MRFPGTRCQPPAFSPIPLGSVANAGMHSVFSTGVVAETSGWLADLHGAEEVLLCGSGTQALQVALDIARDRIGAESLVAAPAYSCFDVASAIIGANAQALLYDLEPTSLSPDLRSLEKVLRAGARILVVAPLYGYPVNYDDVLACARRHGALVIEDAAQGHAARWRGRPLGTIGDIAVLSFGRGKGWTGGFGGAVMLYEKEGRVPAPWPALAGRGSEVRTIVAAVASRFLSSPMLYGIPRSLPFLQLGRTVYHEPERPARMTRTAAALLVRSGAAAAVEGGRRRQNAAWYAAALASLSSVCVPHASPHAEPGYLRFPVLLADDAQVLASAPEAVRLGIAPGYPTALTSLAQLRTHLTPAQPACRGADDLARRLVTLPTHSLLTERDRRKVMDWVARQPGVPCASSVQPAENAIGGLT